ncbi:hypothetical protein [Pulveribacter suum]|uniref:Uncharacterized protein n=1 Tax=Pulveribacter suum TaxID=2116657 RepID=A0A2P1NHW6_9BURK|nr:hypothetical protein [Pulveribacter suum]AVP56635.1 hypothetical protein C7H73_02370 [Pulveribacter suum]
MSRRAAPARKAASGWGRVHAPQRALATSLARRHSLRLHGWIIGSFMLALMWSVSRLLMALGMQSLALRYLATLGVGYLAYLLVLRLWAGWLVRSPKRRKDEGSSWVDGGLPSVDGRSGGASSSWSSGGGGRFAGGGASGDFGGSAEAGTGLFDGSLGDAASGALDAAAGADEGAVVVVPVLAIFVLGAALLAGAGALAWLYFSSEVLLAVAVELAFSVAAARALMGAERAGWLGAAVRLTWKPLLAATVCAALLGAAVQYALPEAQSLPHAVRLLRGR